MSDDQDTENPFDLAIEQNNRVNRLLAEGGSISTVRLTGAIGYHINIAAGETSPEYLWKTALLMALDECIFEMFYIGADTPAKAREELEGQLREHFDPFTTEYIGESFEEKLRQLITTQANQGDAGDTGPVSTLEGWVNDEE